MYINIETLVHRETHWSNCKPNANTHTNTKLSLLICCGCRLHFSFSFSSSLFLPLPLQQTFSTQLFCYNSIQFNKIQSNSIQFNAIQYDTIRYDVDVMRCNKIHNTILFGYIPSNTISFVLRNNTTNNIKSNNCYCYFE